MNMRRFVSGWRSILVAGTLVAGASVTTGGGAATAFASPSQPDFGSSVYIFNPSMPQSQIQATVDAIASQQVGNQFGTQRDALGPAPSLSTFKSATTRRWPAWA